MQSTTARGRQRFISEVWLLRALTSLSGLTLNLGCTRSQSINSTPTNLEHSTRVALRDLPRGEHETPHNNFDWSHPTITNKVLDDPPLLQAI